MSRGARPPHYSKLRCCRRPAGTADARRRHALCRLLIWPPSCCCLCRRSLRRVCQCWQELIDSPPLLRCVAVWLEADTYDDLSDSSCCSGGEWQPGPGGSQSLEWQPGPSSSAAEWAEPLDPAWRIAHVLDFWEWLRLRAAPHVEQLEVRLGWMGGLRDDDGEWERNVAAVTPMLRSTLRACTQLRVSAVPAPRMLHACLALPAWHCLPGAACCNTPASQRCCAAEPTPSLLHAPSCPTSPPPLCSTSGWLRSSSILSWSSAPMLT